MPQFAPDKVYTCMLAGHVSATAVRRQSRTTNLNSALFLPEQDWPDDTVANILNDIKRRASAPRKGSRIPSKVMWGWLCVGIL